MLESLIKALGPDTFKGAAQPEAIAVAERTYGELPAPLRTLWSESEGSRPFRGGQFRFLGPHESVEAWRGQLDFAEQEGLLSEEYVHGPCHQKVFDPRWIPFGADLEGDHLYCLDGYPSPEGILHQVIVIHHLEGLHERVAESLESFVGSLVDEIESELAASEAAAAAEHERQALLRPAVEREVAKYRQCGVEIGPVDELVEDPTFAIGQGDRWTAEIHATRLFLSRIEGLHFRGLVGLEGWATYVEKVATSWSGTDSLGSSLASYIESMRGSWDTLSILARADQIVSEANRLLSGADDPRRLWALVGKGTPYAMRYALLTPGQKQALEEAELVAFRDLSAPPGSGGSSGGFMSKIRRLLS